MLVDTHAHLDYLPKGKTLEEILASAENAGVGKIITIGTSIETSKKSVDLAQKYSGETLQIYASCGIHPHDGKDEVEKLGLSKCIETLRQYAKSAQQVIAIGECGLDYYLAGEKRLPTVYKDKEFQRKLFIEQTKLACEFRLPLIIHCRNAWDEIFEIISKFLFARKLAQSEQVKSSKLAGVFHSWTGDWEAAQKAIDLGFLISFSGIVTFENASVIAEVARKIPLDRMILETDSPFLAPEPLRGRQNEPKNVTICAQFIAGLRRVPFDKIAEATTRNAEKLFRF